MFGFLAPAALAGLALLSVPILLHIFKPRKVRQTPFSSLRWLRASQHRLSRRIKWHQVLLFLLRAAFVVFVVLALAKPVLSPGEGRGVTERFVIVDVGRTMGYQRQDSTVPIDDARRLAQSIVSQTSAGDRATVLLAGTEVRALGPLVSDASVYARPLQSVGAEAGESTLTDALRLVGPMMADRDSAERLELVFITDNQVQNWSHGDMVRFLDQAELPVDVKVLDVGPDAPVNAWIAGARMIEQGMRRYIRVQVGLIGAETQERSVRLTGLPGLAEQSQTVSLSPGRFGVVGFELPTGYELKGKVARLELVPGDDLAADDVHWLNLDVTGAVQVVVVESQSTQIEELQSGFHLRTGLEALSDALPGTITLKRAEPGDILAPVIATADIIMLVDVAQLTSANLQAVQDRVRRGAGLVVFLGPQVDQAYYNSQLHVPNRRSQSLLPVQLGQAETLQGGGGQLPQISQVSWGHPIFSRLFDPVYGDLAQTRFKMHRKLIIPEGDTANVNVLASIEGVGPAIVEGDFGSGKVLLFNTTANDTWSDLPRRKSFVPVLDRLINYLAGTTGKGAFALGEAATVPLPEGADVGSIEVSSPDGNPLKPAVRELAGRNVLQLDDLKTPGVYQVTFASSAGNQTFPIVVQSTGSDSMLARVDEETLRTWWEPAEFSFFVPVGGSTPDSLSVTRVSLEPWMLALACLMLLAEMFFVHWLCPQMNPAVTSKSLVAGRGFFEKNNEPETASSTEPAARPAQKAASST